MSDVHDRLVALRGALPTADPLNAFYEFGQIVDSGLVDVSGPRVDGNLVQLLVQCACEHLNGHCFEIDLMVMEMFWHAPTECFHGRFEAGLLCGIFFYFRQCHLGVLACDDGGSTIEYYRIEPAISGD